ncbi:MAG: MBL fold metallo-hydrolase [Solirubrobacteraceae bacterium]|nr:MBL fold metallo-hydrolase [Solirubrobacteraceae bacterium]
MTSSQKLTRVTQIGAVNAYLVAEDDGLTLVDTGMRGMDRRVLAAAERLGAPIVRVVLTHAHGDHVGGLDALVRRLPEVEVAVSEREAPLLAGDRTLRAGEPQARLRGSYPGTRARAGRLLVPGDRVGSLEVVAAPGHTPGQIALLDARDRTLLCGDAFSTLGGVATTARPNPRFPLPGLATWHRPTALETARALRALRPARLAPGHGRVVDDPLAAMDAAIARGAR